MCGGGQALQRWAVNEVIGPSIDECAAAAAPSPAAAAAAGTGGGCQPWWLVADAGDDFDDGAGVTTSAVTQELLAVRAPLLEPTAATGQAARWAARLEVVGAWVWAMAAAADTDGEPLEGRALVVAVNGVMAAVRLYPLLAAGGQARARMDAALGTARAATAATTSGTQSAAAAAAAVAHGEIVGVLASGLEEAVYGPGRGDGRIKPAAVEEVQRETRKGRMRNEEWGGKVRERVECTYRHAGGRHLPY